MRRFIHVIRETDRIVSFLLRVLRGFRRNQGLLLSGAIAYYALLSIVPMSILILIVLSHFIDPDQLFYTLSTYLEMVIPGYAATLTEQAKAFIEHRKVIGMIGFLVMLFFSSIAFTVLENAMSVIFFLVWYYSAISPVNLIYGSFATVVVFLLSIEAAALILLLGAQVL